MYLQTASVHVITILPKFVAKIRIYIFKSLNSVLHNDLKDKFFMFLPLMMAEFQHETVMFLWPA